MRREVALALTALLLGVFGVWSYPLLVPGMIGFDGDSLFLFYPALDLVREEVFSGRIPLWNPYKFLGSPLLADLMVPLFYPPQFLALMPPQPLGQHLGIVFHALGASLGAWVVARRFFGCSNAGGMFAGLTYALSAPMQVHATHPNQFYAMAWLPWVLAAVLQTLRGDRRWAAALLLGLVLGMQGLAGQPQIVIYSAVIVFLAIAWTALHSPREIPRRSLPLATAAAVTLGLSSVHLLPAFELSRYSAREAGGLEFAQSFSLPLANLKTLVFPGALGGPSTGGYRGEWNFTETAVFLGQPAFALALLGLVAARRRTEVLFLSGGLIVIGLLWALGGSTPIYAGVLKVLPPLAQFRAPSRAFILVVLAISLLSAFGLDGLRSWIAGPETSPTRNRTALGLILLLTAVQAGVLTDFRFWILRPPLTMLKDVTVSGWEQRLSGLIDGEGRLFRLMTEIDYGDESLEANRAKFSRIQPDVNVLHRISVLGGYEEGMLPKRDYIRFMRANLRRIYSPEPDTRLLGLMGIRYVLADKPVRGPGLRFVHAEDGVGLLENLDYRGMVFSRSDWPMLDWPRLDRPMLDRPVLDRIGFESAEVVFRDDGGSAEDEEANALLPPKMRSTRVAPGRIQVEFSGLDDRRLILSETWMPGWRLTLNDGRKIPGRPLAPFLIEFEVPSESGSGEIRYSPRSFAWGLGLTASTAVLLIGGFLLPVFRRRRVGES